MCRRLTLFRSVPGPVNWLRKPNSELTTIVLVNLPKFGRRSTTLLRTRHGFTTRSSRRAATRLPVAAEPGFQVNSKIQPVSAAFFFGAKRARSSVG